MGGSSSAPPRSGALLNEGNENFDSEPPWPAAVRPVSRDPQATPTTPAAREGDAGCGCCSPRFRARPSVELLGSASAMVSCPPRLLGAAAFSNLRYPA
ncbi:MAG: hypothetical protein BJ554DRAFT_7658 [Olpidium bornovanus]|uniref:Uncharacterized protein n=1 Tax=Olpidium bornovanus TaxID=278681 RepID=A0A8H7ZW44_9FUNG|nr:MAG: hypothetical protein BJ554DRAFT_7658 [Olpidium bornovanus]